MTRIVDKLLRCFVCGTLSEQRLPYSTHSRGSPDLDGRPPEMARSTMPVWVQTCPECGYCATELSQGDPSAREAVQRPTYQEQLHAADTPFLANRFLCLALLKEAAGRDADAAQQRLHAAWVADDAQERALAHKYRSAVADALLARREALRRWRGDEADWKGVERVFLVDVLRRAGRFDEARREVDAALQQGVSSIVRQLLGFEYTLLEHEDVGPHTRDEALRGSSLQEAPPPEVIPLVSYIQRYYSEWMTPQEEKALSMGKLRTPEGEQWATDDPQVLALLAGGKHAIVHALEQRLLTEHPGKVFINRCPKCGGLARTPQARQCRYCPHTWRE
ncbi:hypothetical protein [Hyalangium rubrum]|uniref:Uncharacterized protein n=1 Tax=Hyalangium rubrum TaxID=3103134 RepID=A0ABU5HDC6_9BACT|nr:hypothetical protein [Hyalangium sp. s54d21]MDY7231473.1 hypothetical protein [Hyalangium sp. s54d21]